MSNPSSKAAACYELETAWGEAISTFATFRAPATKSIDTSGLTHAKQAADRVVQRLGDGTQPILMNQGGSFKISLYLTGHGTTTSGATTLTATETLLKAVFGNGTVSAASGTTFTGGTATIPITTASATIAAGALIRGGSRADGKGNGQFVAVASHITTTLNLLTGFDTAPAAADVLYSAVNIYPSEDPIAGTTVASTRWLLSNANVQYECHGCYPTSAVISGLNTSQVPMVEITFAVSYWGYNTAITFPSAVATETFQPAANANGSLFVAPTGTVTRATRVYRNFTLTYSINTVSLMGPGGIGAFQAIVGARRTGHAVKLSWTEDADLATLTPVLPGFGTGTTDYHALWTGNPTAGKAMGIYFPRINFTNVPLQKADGNINRFQIEADAYTGGTTTSDLTASSIRLGFA